ncbi:MAG: hypothetical protein PHH37_08250 [Paludibacter sp.]|nr:hypothetical protein [Paludibacter sp.]
MKMVQYKEIYSNDGVNWYRTATVELTDTQKALLESDIEEDQTLKSELIETINTQSKAVVSETEATICAEKYETIKPDFDTLINIAMYIQYIEIEVSDIVVEQALNISGIINYRQHGIHKQLRF